jgi:hypothetical protein
MSNVASLPCRDFPLQKWLLFSGELSTPEQKFWRRHLQACRRCQETWAETQSVLQQYASLPLYEAPEKIIQEILRPAPPRHEVGWLAAFVNRLSLFFNDKPRLALAGMALAALLLASFHYFAFQPHVPPTWDAAAFDQKASELLNTLSDYHFGALAEMKKNDKAGEVAEAAPWWWEEQAANLRESIAALQSDLQSSKL